MTQGTALAESRKVGYAELVTVGIDVSDRYSYLCVLGDDGEILWEERVRTTAAAQTARATAPAPARNGEVALKGYLDDADGTSVIARTLAMHRQSVQSRGVVASFSERYGP